MDVGGNYIMNDNYGGGIFRRRIRLTRHDNNVYGELEDCNHGFRTTVYYDDKVVTRIEAEFMRIPFTTCDDAWKPLNELVGLPIGTSTAEIIKRADPLKNCTHLYDLTLLAIAHIQTPESVVQFDVVISDAEKDVKTLQLFRNEVLIHEWQADYSHILSPENLKGKPLFQGFYQWVNETFSELEHEAALVLQKGNLVSIGRMINVEAMAGGRAIDESDRVACFTYSPERSSEAIRQAGTTRDFTDSPELLLKFT